MALTVTTSETWQWHCHSKRTVTMPNYGSYAKPCIPQWKYLIKIQYLFLKVILFLNNSTFLLMKGLWSNNQHKTGIYKNELFEGFIPVFISILVVVCIGFYAWSPHIKQQSLPILSPLPSPSSHQRFNITKTVSIATVCRLPGNSVTDTTQGRLSLPKHKHDY